MFKLVVLSAALAVASASPSGIWGGLATPWNAGIIGSRGAPIAAPLAASIAAPIAAPLAAAAPIGAYNYRGPLSLAPGQPANILAVDGRPLDTLSVNLDRAAHLTAKAVEGRGHLLKKKRSIIGAPLIAAPLAAAPLAAAPWAGSRLYAAPLAAAPAVAVSQSSRIDIPAASVIASSPLSISAASRIAPLGLGYGAGLGQLW